MRIGSGAGAGGVLYVYELAYLLTPISAYFLYPFLYDHTIMSLAEVRRGLPHVYWIMKDYLFHETFLSCNSIFQTPLPKGGTTAGRATGDLKVHLKKT
jgi:hypothetical protein